MAPINQGELPDAEVADGAALELGSTIRALRRQAGLTVEQLAGNVGVSRSLISAIELGRAGPSIGTLRGIAQALNVPMAALFTGDADPSVADGNGSGQRMVVRAVGECLRSIGGQQAPGQRAGRHQCGGTPPAPVEATRLRSFHRDLRMSDQTPLWRVRVTPSRHLGRTRSG